jgi:hypothetical protein
MILLTRIASKFFSRTCQDILLIIPVIKHYCGWLENPQYMAVHSWETPSINELFSVATFDYRRVPWHFDNEWQLGSNPNTSAI